MLELFEPIEIMNISFDEIDSHNFDFLEDEYTTIGEIKKDVDLYEL